MNITDVRIKLIDKEDSKLKAIAEITIDDCFVVHDIKVIDGEKRLFVSMPSKQLANGEHKDIAHPILPATRAELDNKVIEAYKNALNG